LPQILTLFGALGMAGVVIGARAAYEPFERPSSLTFRCLRGKVGASAANTEHAGEEPS
jgi:hypothetical protein